MGGQSISDCEITDVGLAGDRGWGVVDTATGNVLTARREPRLLFATAELTPAGELLISLPDGTRVGADGSEALSHWLDRPVSLERAGDVGGVYEVPLDTEAETDWISWQGPPSAWHDTERARVSLVSTASIGAWDVRRFRANVLLDGGGEDALVGATIRIGTATLDVVKMIERCVMVSRAQPGVEADREVLRAIIRERENCLAVGARVRDPGVIAKGDEIEVLASGG
jgi:hypothetical protein